MRTSESSHSTCLKTIHCHGLSLTHGINAETLTKFVNGLWTTQWVTWSEEMSVRIEFAGTRTENRLQFNLYPSRQCQFLPNLPKDNESDLKTLI